MEGFDGHPGTSRLARILSQRMKKENEAPLVMDFGEIQANGSLVTNTFPLPIPKGDYSLCGRLKEVGAGAGSRVLVAWVQNEAVAIDLIGRS